MKLFLADNAYLLKDNAGNYYSAGIYSNEFFRRYQKVFGKIKFMAKIHDIPDSADIPLGKKINPEYVEIIDLPPFRGIGGLVKSFPAVLKAVRKAVAGSDCMILRMMQFEGMLCWFFRGRRPYAVEAVNDPMGDKRFPALLNKGLIMLHKRIIHKASAVSYVTRHTLQKKYPYTGTGMQSWYSSVELPDESLMEPKDYPAVLTTIKIAHVANVISGNSKGHETMVRAVKRIRDAGVCAECFFYGEGPSVPGLKQLCRQLGVADAVHFMGYVDGKEELLFAIRECDLFVLPSETEGLPRCLIEACAAGLPCLASGVGGIPELLHRDYLIPYDDDAAYAREILRLYNAPEELAKMSRENAGLAKRFCRSRLEKRRTEFYRYLKRVSGKRLYG